MEIVDGFNYFTFSLRKKKEKKEASYLEGGSSIVFS